jgi:hypothetical protein
VLTRKQQARVHTAGNSSCELNQYQIHCPPLSTMVFTAKRSE